MARRNVHNQKKRQKELARKQKAEEKRRLRQARKEPGEDTEETPDTVPNPSGPQTVPAGAENLEQAGEPPTEEPEER